MNKEELIKDLNNKCPSRPRNVVLDYFKFKLFKNDDKIYARRTFGDLFKLYRFKGVSEALLMECLVSQQFRAYRCPDIKNIVFFKYTHKHKFWCVSEERVTNRYKNTFRFSNYGKYTPEYLENLYNSIFNK